jgi:hypothetical protein
MAREREGGRPPKPANVRYLYLKRKLPGETYDAFVARLMAEMVDVRAADDVLPDRTAFEEDQAP